MIKDELNFIIGLIFEILTSIGFVFLIFISGFHIFYLIIFFTWLVFIIWFTIRLFKARKTLKNIGINDKQIGDILVRIHPRIKDKKILESRMILFACLTLIIIIMIPAFLYFMFIGFLWDLAMGKIVGIFLTIVLTLFAIVLANSTLYYKKELSKK